MPVPKETVVFAVNTLVTALVVGGASTIAKQNPILAGFITALPLSTIMALTLVYTQTGDGAAASKYALSIAVAVFASALFFAPFLFYAKFKGSFWPYLLVAVATLALSAQIQRAIMTRWFGAS